jgi:ATP phosphoribosyltransferase
MEIFEKVGITPAEDLEKTRKLLIPSADGKVRFLVIRDKDLPTYVDYGAADMGIVGKDVLIEAGRDLLEPIDLGFGFCRIVVAELASRERGRQEGWDRTRIATKYPRITEGHFASKGQQVEIIPLYGSIELAPLVGLADRIVDLVSTGETLRQNNLVETEEVASVTARLVVNRASLKTKSEVLVPLIEELKRNI